MTCRYRDCPRTAVKGWTTCGKHKSAGCSLAQEARKVKRPRLVCPNGHAMDDGYTECPACGAYRAPRSL